MVSWNRLEETVTWCDCGGLRLRGGPSWTRDQLPVLREQCVGKGHKQAHLELRHLRGRGGREAGRGR